MIKVKTFSTQIKIFNVIRELEGIDEQVNEFIKAHNIENVISVSDTCTTDDKGATIGVIRVLTYEA